MTNTIVLLSVLLQTNWVDSSVIHDGLMVQIGRCQTNYVVRPSADFKRADVIKLLPPPSNTNALSAVQFGKAYPILTSQPFYGPYNLVREVIQPNVYIVSNISGNWRGIILTNSSGTEWKFPFPSTEVFTNSTPRMPPGL